MSVGNVPDTGILMRMGTLLDTVRITVSCNNKGTDYCSVTNLKWLFGTKTRKL